MVLCTSKVSRVNFILSVLTTKTNRQTNIKTQKEGDTKETLRSVGYGMFLWGW
jgi:hypothetical protein